MPSIKRRWTVDDVHSLPHDGNRYEVLDGATSPEPRPEILTERLLWAPAGGSAPLTIDLARYFATVLGA